MSTGSFWYLSRRDVEDVGLTMTEIISALDAMFREKGEGRTEMPPKPGIHTRQDAFIHAMPAYIPGLESAGVKWISGYPGNQKRGLPYINGLLILNDPETGIPIAVMDGAWITAQRTGAATAVAAKYLARPESSTVGIIACGVQGTSNLEALCATFPVSHVFAYDAFPDVSRRFAAEMSAKLGLAVEVVSRPKDAVVNSDIVVTSGPILKEPSPVIEAGWLREGAFASPVDYDCYWKREALEQADKFATDDIGQMEYSRRNGYFLSSPKAYADLGEIAAGKAPGRETEKERTICINLGIALDDMATAIMVYRKAREMGIGLELPL